ncbi:MAG TPA: hypothetical protein VFP55_00375, partial [Solirubrobacteraceae bacterium]|nr:hypothetical protein [Solirubrobacteraceae bacterium]
QALAEAGWRRMGETEYAVQLDAWASAREPLAAAMNAAITPWLPYFGTHDLSTPEALEQVYDQPILLEGRKCFADWLAADHPSWLTASLAS